ncbi:MAG: Hsp20/alpha crystallin family protein [Methylocystis sp.]|nr:Hsp20/alpha crystallin family protein [Methylocystis sp.]
MRSLLPSLFFETGLPRDPFATMRRQMEEMMRGFGREWPLTTEIGAGAPAVNVAESDKAFEITAELPGVDEKDIKVELEGARVIVSGEKKREREEKEKDWHVVECSYGSFHRALTLPFEPALDAVTASFDKGVLRVAIAKPAGAKPTTKTIEIKPVASGAATPAIGKKAA